MKKLLISLLITALALICTACANAAANSEASVAQPELKYGRYYLNGDKDSGLYVDLDENSIVMGGENLRKHQEEFCRKNEADYPSEEKLQENVDEIVVAYGTKSEYNYVTMQIGEEYHNYLFFDYFHNGTFDKTQDSGSAYEYPKEGMLSTGNDDFYLA
ncbi:MAG: hypothetical protein ACI4JI_10195 [Ruminiclostridium sp.]